MRFSAALIGIATSVLGLLAIVRLARRRGHPAQSNLGSVSSQWVAEHSGDDLR
jgi:hypothetical protein